MPVDNMQISKASATTSTDRGGLSLDRQTDAPLLTVRNNLAAETEEVRGNLLLDYFRTFVRHKALIASMMLCGVVGSLLIHLTTQPVYRTRTSLQIESLNSDFLNLRSVDPTTAGSSNDTNVQTQIKLLESDSLMERVQEQLTTEAHPQSVKRTDLLSQIRQTLHFGRPELIPYRELLRQTVKGVKVKPLGITSLVEVTCDSWDPEFSARFCNTLINEYQAADLENRGSAAKRTSDWLMHQAADIRQKAEDSEQRLVAATGGNGLVLSQESSSVGEERLRELQSELVKAQAYRMEKEAEVDVARHSSAESTPTVVDNPAYAASRAKLADLQGQVAALVPPLTEANPKIIHLRSQIKQVQEGMSTQRDSSVDQLQNEYLAAKHREDLIDISYKSQQGTVSTNLEKGAQVALLRREVESEQQLYQTLLQRAKEAGFASAMQASTVRVVDAAQKPTVPVFPRHGTAMVVGLVLGSLLGTVIAFFKERNLAVFRSPGECERVLQVHELGVIPSPPSANWLMQRLPTRPTKLALAATDQHPSLRIGGWGERFSIVAEAYRNATISMMMSGKLERPPVYVVSSASSGEGKTTVTSNLGVALSRSKLRVVLVDGDLRKSSLHKVFSLANTVGVRTIVRGDVDLATAPLSDYCQPTSFPGLSVVTAGLGSEEAVGLLHSIRLETLLNHLTKHFDVVLVDTPPALHMADTRIIAGKSDGVILILRSGVTARSAAVSARDLFDRDRVRIIGTVLNDFNPSQQGQWGYYKSYYAYQTGSEGQPQFEVRS